MAAKFAIHYLPLHHATSTEYLKISKCHTRNWNIFSQVKNENCKWSKVQMFLVSFPHLSDFKMPNSISETQTNKTDFFPLTSTVNISQPSIQILGKAKHWIDAQLANPDPPKTDFFVAIFKPLVKFWQMFLQHCPEFTNYLKWQPCNGLIF